jgi:catalase
MSIENPIRYSSDIETPDAEEVETIQKIIDSMTHESEITAERYQHPVRASHAKSTALLKGSLEVIEGLPEALRQGLFSEARRYPVVARLAQGPGELLKDDVSTHRGMSIKVFDVDGTMLDGHAGRTQDFVLASGPVFPASDAAHFLANMKGLEKAASMPEGVKHAVSVASRGTNAAIRAVGGDSAMLDFFGHPPCHPFAEPYYSQAALRFGDYVAKLGVFPVGQAMLALGPDKLDVSDPDVFRHSVETFMRDNVAEFEVRIQLCTDLEAMPVEDASKRWPEEDSPYRPVARLVFEPQAAHSESRAAYFNDRLTFRPAHSLEAHRPLGSIMRARLMTYQALQDFRHQRTGLPMEEPRFEEIPD